MRLGRLTNERMFDTIILRLPHFTPSPPERPPSPEQHKE